MSKTAYVVRHIHFENAGILEPLLIERGSYGSICRTR